MNSEEELIERARQGDESAFTALVSEHKRRVFRVCLAMLGDWQAADEAAQDVFVKMYESLSSFRSESRLGTWLYRVTFNVCAGRRRRLTRWISFEAEPRESVSADRPDLWLERREDIEKLHRALSRLPMEFQGVLILRELEGRTYEMIAEVLGIAIGTVESRLFRGRRRLREMLEKEDSDGLGS